MIAVVVGMHRSGTSTVAGLLHQGGVVMGEDRHFLPPPSDENPLGFFENHRFRRVNDRIAARAGYAIKSWRPDVPPIQPGALARYGMRRLLREYATRYESWGFKDPRSCLTLTGWLAAAERVGLAPEMRVIFVSRDPSAVARSMLKRGDTDLANALRLWSLYNDRALTSIDAWDPPTYYLRYEDLCREPAATADALLRFVGQHASAEARAFVSPSLDRSASEPDGSPGALADRVRATADIIAGRVRASRARAPHPNGTSRS